MRSLLTDLMNPLAKPAAVLAVAAAPLLMLGCPPDADTTTTVSTTDADNYDAGADGDAHAHTAMHGGDLVEVGEHEYSLELVPGDGNVTVYVMDAHHENPVMVASDDIELEIDKEDGDEVELDGEAVDAADGKASQFVFTLPDGMTLLTSHGDHFDYAAEGHFHLTIDGTEYEPTFGGEGHGHDHDDHDDKAGMMKAEGGSGESGTGSPVLIEAGSN